MAEKWILAPPGKWEKNGRKMENCHFGPFLGQFSHFSAIFLPFSRWGQNPFFGFFFPVSGQRPEMGSVPATRIATLRSTSYQGQFQIFICNAKRLDFVVLSRNDLSGPLPSCINNFFVWLDENRLGGSISEPNTTVRMRQG